MLVLTKDRLSLCSNVMGRANQACGAIGSFHSHAHPHTLGQVVVSRVLAAQVGPKVHVGEVQRQQQLPVPTAELEPKNTGIGMNVAMFLTPPVAHGMQAGMEAGKFHLHHPAYQCDQNGPLSRRRPEQFLAEVCTD